MDSTRSIEEVLRSNPTIEGAGVHLRRVFGYDQVPRFDPFLLLDDFHSSNPRDYLAGFPWHPHRGIETVSYVLHGRIEHGDSLGNSGVIGDGDVQWMTAGSGIVHQEMPKRVEGELWGFQLWVNLPASHKMMPPRYRDVAEADIPVVEAGPGASVRLICGTLEGTAGAVHDIVAEPRYFNVSLEAGARVSLPTTPGHTVFAYVIDGAVRFGDSGAGDTMAGSVVLFGDGDGVEASASAAGGRFLFVSGKPIGEPVAWYGPIVMNTEQELDVAFEEYRNGTFIKTGT